MFVITPKARSTSAFFSEVFTDGQIKTVDAVNVLDREILFVQTKTHILAWVFAEHPKAILDWPQKTENFTLRLTAKNPKSTGTPYSLNFTILDLNETIIEPTEKFDKEEIRKLGHETAPHRNHSFTKDIMINDSEWFTGNVLNFTLNCSNCGRDKMIRLDNHIQETRDIVDAKYVYDIESTHDGIFAQQYYSLFKTYEHNDSIHYINQIPTTRLG